MMVNNGYQWLVGGLEHHWIMNFPSLIGNGIIIPTDEPIFFRGVGIPVYHQPAV
jgi:hypothetical protein